MCSFEDIREGKSLIIMINGFFAVRPAWAQSCGLKSLTRPSSGKCIA